MVALRLKVTPEAFVVWAHLMCRAVQWAWYPLTGGPYMQSLDRRIPTWVQWVVMLAVIALLAWSLVIA